MAYIGKYVLYYGSPYKQGKIIISEYTEEESSSGSSTELEELTLEYEFPKISYNFSDWDSHIIGLTCEFDIRNTKSDYFELLPLLYAEARNWKVEVFELNESLEITKTLFSGFINCDTNKQKYLHKQTINIAASSYISKAEYFTPDSIETLQNMSFIDIIDEILCGIGAEFNIRVNCSLCAYGLTLESGRTLFNKNGFYTEAFWEDDVERKTAEDILNAILLSFNCYLYWKDNYWYIERLKDIWNESVSYVEYTTGISYGINDSGSVVNSSRTIYDVQDLRFSGETQELSVIPGLRKITLNLSIEDHLLLNLTSSLTLDNSSDLIGNTVPYPGRRTWERYEETGEKHWIHASAMYYSGSSSYVPNDTYQDITNGIYRHSDYGWEKYRGLYTRFLATITEGTQITITFKYGLSKTFFNANRTREDCTFFFYWYLRNTPGNYYIMYNDSGEVWERVSATQSSGIQTKEVAGTSFDEDTNTVEVTLTIQLSDIESFIDTDQSFVLCLGYERFAIGEEEKENPDRDTACVYGDIVIEANNALDDNVVEGKTNTKFLDSEDVTVDLCDVSNLNYANGILQGTDFANRTTGWYSAQDSTIYTIVEQLLLDYFLLRNVSRQKLVGEVDLNLTTFTSGLEMLMLFQDSAQSNKKFILMNLIHEPSKYYEHYEVTLMEFDTDTDIILQEIEESSSS